jgi:ABC-2 type transport system permease protein
VKVVASQTGALFVRLTRLLARQPIWLVIMLVQPMFWLLLYSQLFRRVVDLPGFGTSSYTDYLAPGIAIMTAFFSGSWAGMGMIDDLDRGVIERFLAAPAHRSAIVLARVLQSGVTAAVQAVIILVVALPLGATNAGLPGWIVIVLTAFLVAAGFSGISNGIALLTRQEATMIAAANFVALPLLFFSSILIARDLIPGWMRSLSLVNPVEWAARSARGQVLPGTDWAEILLYLVLLAAFTVCTTAFATRCFRIYQRTL